MQVAFYFAGEITQVLDAIPWVRCASGNVCFDASPYTTIFLQQIFILQQTVIQTSKSLLTCIGFLFWQVLTVEKFFLL